MNVADERADKSPVVHAIETALDISRALVQVDRRRDGHDACQRGWCTSAHFARKLEDDVGAHRKADEVNCSARAELADVGESRRGVFAPAGVQWMAGQSDSGTAA